MVSPKQNAGRDQIFPRKVSKCYTLLENNANAEECLLFWSLNHRWLTEYNHLAGTINKTTCHSCYFIGNFHSIGEISIFIIAHPHRYRHSPWPVDVTQLFPRFCCWTLIWLSRHWAWLRREYWRYRSLIDWNLKIRVKQVHPTVRRPKWRLQMIQYEVTYWTPSA